MTILITYCTAHNTTALLAKRIAQRLSPTHPVEVLPITSIPTTCKAGITPYSAVILGSAIHMGTWLSPAKKFLAQHRAELGGMPVWAFSVGVPTSEEMAREEERKMEGEIKKVVPGLRGHRLFKGRIEKEDLPWVVRTWFRWFPGESKFGDFVEWEEVEKWADGVGEEMKGVLGEAAK
ncbi:Flavodoxin domain-containing protein [Podospora aff. communis PSN243]|uniref:Flavodoxin domain-containing protein n=1 Tax=Podospora aff. communis PSN243 TaxID=3040156 RepID=A0AAV9H4L5_9PEZI|nr:Flavodoxin domain-containing protein [Podospora aff. communis PSN243]